MPIKEYNFKKGVSGNPNGRPKGSFSPLRKQLMELRKIAINDSSEIYQELREKMKSGEAWAYQIYFKELASMPKEWLNEVDTSNVFKDINNMKEFQHSKITLFQSLINLYIHMVTLIDNNSMSKDEILELIKLFNNTKINDYILKDKKVTNIFEDYDDIMKEIGL